ncbi:MAG TPA: hypothetical protein VLV17_02900 [Anaeromyxobacteraceae bacterium]|nr:hypothetical protein [Anaeromyxobacteraceae bacterium]
MSQTVLDRLREAVLDSRQPREGRPGEPGRRIFVRPDGRIVVGDATLDDEGQALSEVHPAVFAAAR